MYCCSITLQKNMNDTNFLNNLISQENTNVIPFDSNKSVTKNPRLRQEIVQSVVTGKCCIPEDLVEQFDVTYDQAIMILTDPSFVELLNKYSKAKLNLFYKGYATNRLVEIAQSEDNKESIQAIKLIAQVSDNLKSNAAEVNVNLNLETLVKETEKVIHPEHNIIEHPVLRRIS